MKHPAVLFPIAVAFGIAIVSSPVIADVSPSARVLPRSLLLVSALSEDTIAAPGNREPNYIVVSVTHTDGNPVTGLTAEDFKVDPLIVGPGGALVNITDVSEPRLPGFYIIDVVPIGMETWKSGVYIFGIAVTHGADKGQALAKVLMD